MKSVPTAYKLHDSGTNSGFGDCVAIVVPAQISLTQFAGNMQIEEMLAADFQELLPWPPT